MILPQKELDYMWPLISGLGKFNVQDKEGVLEYQSPHMILNQIYWYYKKHCQY